MAFELPDVLASAPGMRAAELIIDGLAVFCFNQTSAEPFWEVAYPRLVQHHLAITIQELDGDDNEVGEPIPIDPGIERFTISLTNGSLQHYNLFPHGGPWANGFHRNPSDDDPHDLQWMFDLAGDELQHGRFLGLKPRDESHPRSVASIRHSLFCNLKPERESVRISPRIHNDPNGSGNFDPGPSNTLIVGVLLATEPGDIQFEFHPGGLTTIDPLRYDENKRYRIEIKNEDEDTEQTMVGDFVRGDLRLFYDQLINVSGPEKDLWAITLPEVAPDGDCHTPRFSGPTFEP
jgi:hypothetical protein